MLRHSCLMMIFTFATSFVHGQNPALQKQLTIESIFSPGGITGRVPEGLHWAPDQKSLTFIQRNDSGEHAQLWSVDARTGEKKLLIDDEKLAKLAPSIESIPDDRQKDRINRYHVAPTIGHPIPNTCCSLPTASFGSTILPAELPLKSAPRRPDARS
jgi:hypothetical protein